MPNKLGKKNGQLGELLPFALAVPNNQMAQSNLHQPEIRGAYVCAPDASGRHIPMLCQPKLSRGACQCATGALAAGVALLCDFWVGEREFRQLAAPGRRFCAVCEGLRCATFRYRPLAHKKRPSGGFWWVPMCGCLAEWHRGAQNKKGDLTGWSNLLSAVRTRLEPAQARAFRAIHVTPRRQRRLPPRGASAARSRRPQNKKGDLTGWSNLLSAVRTRLENQLKHPLQTLAGVLSFAYLCQ